MAINIKITTGRYHWTTKGKIHVCGFIWNNDEYTESFPFVGLTEDHSACFEEFRKWCSGLNGQYSIVVEKSAEVWLATSHIWSYPLFYTCNDHDIRISDNPDELNHDFSLSNQEVILHFLHFCATPAGTTLVQSISQLRPGEICRLTPDGYLPAHFSGTGEYEFREPASPEELKELLYKTFSKYNRHFANRKILLPLTSGYDSRLLACLLKDFGIRDVICATWGRVSMPERKTAEKVARKLGFRYIFIPYDENLIGDFENDPEITGFMHYTGHYSSMPYLQDYFAIRKLIADGVIDTHTIAFPGLSGDFIRGSHLFDELFSRNDAGIAAEIMRMFGTSYVRGKEERQKVLQAMLRYHFNGLGHLPNVLKFDLWDYTERQCKFIGNSSRVYHYFDIPEFTFLRDRELVRFFLSLPAVQRVGAVLYNETLEKLIFRQSGVDFDQKKGVSTSRKFSAVKETIIGCAPNFLRRIYYPLDDDVYYREITGKLIKSDKRMVFRDPLKSHFYNCYMTQWYYQYVLFQQKFHQKFITKT